MTKTDGGAMAARGMELKKELWRLVKEIVDEDDYMVETADQAITTLCSLKYLKQSNNTLSFKLDDHAFTVPQEFRCPISKELMKDPVVLATGQGSDVKNLGQAFHGLILLFFWVRTYRWFYWM